jgi:putative ABC transport system substrate-binding protein
MVAYSARYTVESDAETRIWSARFVQRLQELSWVEGRNLIIDYRYGSVGMNRMPDFAKELIALRPDLILAGATTAAVALRQNTFSIPIVFVQVPDSIEIGLVTNFSHPGGNITGFTNFEPATAGKWLQMLKDMSPGMKKAVVMFDPINPSWAVYVRALEAAAAALSVSLIPGGVRDLDEIRRIIETSAPEGGAALVVLPSPVTHYNRDGIIALASHHRWPAVYPYRYFAAGGGLISYGPDLADQYRRAGDYVDRILKGEKPADLPVQAPVKYELVVNLKTAKALGLDVQPMLLARADEVIE